MVYRSQETGSRRAPTLVCEPEVPGERPCVRCGSMFRVEPEEAAFLKRIGPEVGAVRYTFPFPEMCPHCRRQRRTAFRNQGNLYRRFCDKTEASIVSIYRPDSPYKVFHHESWWARKRRALDYGRAFDFDRSFFEQFHELQLAVPVESVRIVNCENCEYCNNVVKCRNSYLIVGSTECETCMYLDGCRNCKDMALGWMCAHCEVSYHLFRCENLFQCFYCEVCFGGNDLLFCRLCRDCSDCFGCCGLQHKKYCIFNKQHTKAEYEAFVGKLDLGSFQAVEHYKRVAAKFYASVPNKPFVGRNNTSCVGDIMYNSKHVEMGFTVFDCEDSRYIYECAKCVQSMDLDNTKIATGSCYQSIHCTTLFNVQFAYNSHNCGSSAYLMDCIEALHCFGCVGVYNERYCILNCSYSRDEYYVLLKKIIEHMIKTGEWGKFFPPELSRFGYNETPAMGNYPRSRAEVDGEFNWSEFVERRKAPDDSVPSDELPDSIAETGDDVLGITFRCKDTGLPYRIQPRELRFYRQYEIPLPRCHPVRQYKDLRACRNKMYLYPRVCDCEEDSHPHMGHCDSSIETSFPPEHSQKVYCVDCYQRAIYYG